VEKCDLFAKNWRNRVYRIELAHGGFVLGKQLVRGTDAMLQYQYEELRVLAALQIPGLHVPNTFGLLPAKRLLLIEFVPGKTIETLAWTSEDVVPACELAGKILARLQLARTESICAMPVEVIAQDLEGAMAPFPPGKENPPVDA
jgi:Ser/Thr protein kinase RdoA (MazF antagonist)